MFMSKNFNFAALGASVIALAHIVPAASAQDAERVEETIVVTATRTECVSACKFDPLGGVIGVQL
jgi:hypothetical protein